MLKLNIGCGTDYREGYVNIDGSDTLHKVDQIIDLSKESLLSYYQQLTVGHVLANDIIEHHYHWEAVKLFNDVYAILTNEGLFEIKVPDASKVISAVLMSTEHKLNLLYGSQDVAMGRDKIMDESRKNFPQYFCHKYGWTKKRLLQDLSAVGFTKITFKRKRVSLSVFAIK